MHRSKVMGPSKGAVGNEDDDRARVAVVVGDTVAVDEGGMREEELLLNRPMLIPFLPSTLTMPLPPFDSLRADRRLW